MSTIGCGIKDVPAGGRILAAGASVWFGMRASLPYLVAYSSSSSAYQSGVDDHVDLNRSRFLGHVSDLAHHAAASLVAAT